MVGIRLAGLPVAVPALVDSGALGNRFGAEVGRAAGLDLSLGPTATVQIGGRRMIGNRLTVGLQLGDHAWTADVLFMEDWTVSYQVLGLRGFFDQFDVRIRASAQRMTILRK